MNSDSAEIGMWLRRLKWSLASLPSAERDDIVEETRSHLREVVAAGRAPSEALMAFGAPEDYGRRFIDEMNIVAALGSQDTRALLYVVARQVNRSLIAALAVICIAGLVLLALIAISMLALKLFDPVHVGLWRGANQFFIGKIDNPANATELLGFWLYPLCTGVLASIWLIGRLTLLFVVRRLARAGARGCPQEPA